MLGDEQKELAVIALLVSLLLFFFNVIFDDFKTASESSSFFIFLLENLKEISLTGKAVHFFLLRFSATPF